MARPKGRPKKEINRKKLIEYLGNPENDFIDRQDLSVDVLGYKDGAKIYTFFSPAELNEIDREAFELRKKRSTRILSDVYSVLAEKAKSGDVQAIKEYLERIEGKVVTKTENKNENTGNITVNVGFGKE